MDKLLDKTLREIIAENKIVYINRTGMGVGNLALGGKEVIGKKALSISAETNTLCKVPVKLRVDLQPALVSFNDIGGDNENDQES